MKINILFFIISLSIVFGGCTSSIPEKVYQPEKNSEVNSYFINGIPIGVLSDDSLIIMAIMKPENVAGEDYIKLWLLYGNKMNTEYLLAPLEFATMTLEIDTTIISKIEHYKSNIKPESPTKILADIENEKAKALIITAIGGALQTLSTQNTKIYDKNKKEILSIGDKDVKNEYILQKTKEQLNNTAYYFDIFQESVNQGILRRNTLFPYRSVSGYLYMPVPEIKYRYITFQKSGIYQVEYFSEHVLSFNEIVEYLHKIIFKFNTPVGIKTIEFKPIKGE